MYYDSHTHLNDEKLYPDYISYIKNFISQGGKGVVNIGVNDGWNERGIEIVENLKKLISQGEIPEIFIGTSIGYHPEHIGDKSIKKKDFKNRISNLQNLYEKHKSHIVAIGEAGIDTHYEGGYETLPEQKAFFAMQLDLCQELNLPIVIHSRDDFESTWDVIQNYKNLKIYFHCWGYGPDEIKRLELYFPNLWIGFAGNVTYPKALSLKESLLVTDINHILIETDAPYLAPQKVRGTMNEPINVKYIYDFAAENRITSLEKLQTQIENNFRRLYWK